MNMIAKFMTVGSLALSLGSVSFGSLRAAPPEREGLPPGLQKKEKLPPGWQKKVGNNSVSVTTNTTVTTTTTTTVTATPRAPVTPPTPTAKPPEVVVVTPPAPPLTPTTPSAPPPSTTWVPPTRSTTPVSTKPLTREQRENLARMERALADLEHQASRPAAADRLLHRLSNRQNIAVGTLQTQLSLNPGLTVPQLYVATIIAKEGHTSTEQVLQARRSGASWGDIASSHKVGFGDIAERLRGAEDAAREAANTEQKRSVR